MRIKILAAVYFLILVVIVILVDRRETQYLFRFFYNVPYFDKIGHFCLMGMFAFLLNLAMSARTVKVWRLNLLLGSLIVLTVVVIEEFSQIWVSGRTFDVGDLACDFAGILIFGELARWLINRGKKNQSVGT